MPPHPFAALLLLREFALFLEAERRQNAEGRIEKVECRICMHPCSSVVIANLTVTGTAPSGANVTVTPSNTIWTSETYWYGNLAFSGNNANGPQWTSINITSNLSGNVSTVTGNLYLPANPEVFSYDADGNLLADGRWNYIYDAENRLSALVTTDEAHSAGVPRQSIAFGYDSQNRRIGKVVFDYNASGNGTWVLTQSVKYLYDGWNLIAEMNSMPATPSVVRTYAWGNDLSGSMSGAGGVGGLLMANLSDNSTTKTVYYGYDANGNVITLADTSGNVVATYDYDPFGNTVRATGSWAVFNPIRFSTKYNEISGTYAGKDVGLYYYGARWLRDGRWISRDPAEEDGGLNLYGTGNDLVNNYDVNGLKIPDPAEKDPGSSWLAHNIVIGGGDFPGSGWQETAYTRPVQLFDLAAKIHDFMYTDNNLAFTSGSTADQMYDSKIAKANFIFNHMNEAAPTLGGFQNDIWSSIADQYLLPGDKCKFRKGDGFKNVLLDPAFIYPTYLMIPWDYIPTDQQRAVSTPLTVLTRTFAGQNRPTISHTTIYLPNYDTPTQFDKQNADWQKWAASIYTSAFWGAIRNITDQTDSTYVWKN